MLEERYGVLAGDSCQVLEGRNVDGLASCPVLAQAPPEVFEGLAVEYAAIAQLAQNPFPEMVRKDGGPFRPRPTDLGKSRLRVRGVEARSSVEVREGPGQAGFLLRQGDAMPGQGNRIPLDLHRALPGHLA